MKRCLILTLGFTESDLVAVHQSLKQKGWANRVKAIGRNYSCIPQLNSVKFDTKDYDFIIEGVHRSLFSDKGRMIFCAHNSKSCSLKFGKSKASCLNTEPSTCRDEKPELIILFYMSSEKFRIGGRLGRFALPIRCPAELFGKSQRLAKFVIDQVSVIEGASVWSDIRRKDVEPRVLLPVHNFENADRIRLLNSMESFESFRGVINSLSKVIQKKGQKFIDARNLEFQVDSPHRYPTSDCPKLDWLNAHYRHGMPFDLRHHYDVTARDGKAVGGNEFLNIFSGERQAYAASHLNIFTNDEVQK